MGQIVHVPFAHAPHGQNAYAGRQRQVALAFMMQDHIPGQGPDGREDSRGKAQAEDEFPSQRHGEQIAEPAAQHGQQQGPSRTCQPGQQG